MKRSIRSARHGILPGVLVVVLSLVLPGICADIGGKMLIQKRDCVIRTEPSFIAAAAGTLKYHDSVLIREEKGQWRRITSADGKLSGWIHSTALATREMSFNDAPAPAEMKVSSGEVGLASRGINAAVEEAFRAGNKDLNFSAVDKMEAFSVRTEALSAFARTGKLAGEGR
ncbi:MAG: hypothetical protein C0404_03945 [Verrucomicrobia bacterium]|nr:hypothetical protein [Verrucomicrobiota bacterium]